MDYDIEDKKLNLGAEVASLQEELETLKGRKKIWIFRCAIFVEFLLAVCAILCVPSYVSDAPNVILIVCAVCGTFFIGGVAVALCKNVISEWDSRISELNIRISALEGRMYDSER